MRGGDGEESKMGARITTAGAAEAVAFSAAVFVVIAFLIWTTRNQKAFLEVSERQGDGRTAYKRKISDNFNLRVYRVPQVFQTSRLTISAGCCAR